MNQLSLRLLQLKPRTMLLLSFLGVPQFLWLFSIVHQLDKKRGVRKSGLEKATVGILTLYPVLYFFFFLAQYFNVLHEVIYIPIAQMMPFHLAAMACGFVLLVLAAKSYVKFEEHIGKEDSSTPSVFFLLWWYIFGIMVLQPKLNQYVKE